MTWPDLQAKAPEQVHSSLDLDYVWVGTARLLLDGLAVLVPPGKDREVLRNPVSFFVRDRSEPMARAARHLCLCERCFSGLGLCSRLSCTGSGKTAPENTCGRRDGGVEKAGREALYRWQARHWVLRFQSFQTGADTLLGNRCVTLRGPDRVAQARMEWGHSSGSRVR